MLVKSETVFENSLAFLSTSLKFLMTNVNQI